MPDKKAKILKGMGGIPAESLLKYIEQGYVSFAELMENGLLKSPDKLQFIKSQLSIQEDSQWQSALNKNTVEGYIDFLNIFPDSTHASDARIAIAKLDESYWQNLQNNITEEGLKKYIQYFPQGNYINECNELLSDLPWLEVKKHNTIAAYEEYRQSYPGKHEIEIQTAITNIQDDSAWEKAETNRTLKAYKDYLSLYPKGRHATTANERINNRSLKDTIIEKLLKDDNAYSAFKIQEYVQNNTLTWNDLEAVFLQEQIDSIKGWKQAAILPHSVPPQKLQRDSTEVYFWGTKGTGKTCAMGAILSAAKRNGILVAQQCKHRVYLDQLANLFAQSANGSICNLPDSNPIDSISEMLVHLVDKDNKPHKVTFLDLAGEVVTGIYKIRNGIPLLESEENTIKQVMSYLQDSYNNKIHFFVVDYGAAKSYVKELLQEGYQVLQEDVLSDIASFLAQKKGGGGLFKSTVGVYVLVTKTDLIPVSPADRPQASNEYVTTELASFWNQIKNSCAAANVKEVKTIAFSIGDVFAQSLCKFEKEASEKVINLLQFKTKADYTGFFKFLFN